jgi:hypothetical protein
MRCGITTVIRQNSGRLSVFHVTCYMVSLHVIHCKGALNFGEVQPVSSNEKSFSRIDQNRA